MSSQDQKWAEAVQSAVSVGKSFGSNAEDFNIAASHVAQLLEDASRLLGGGSHSTSIFLAITAIEETSKLHAGMFRRSNNAVARGKDPLFKHAHKHLLAATPTVAMGSRLAQAIGKRRVSELLEQLASGEFISLRESALYFEASTGKIRSPRQIYTREQGREILLLAIEIFDDALVGYTNHSTQLGEGTDAIFGQWAGA